MSGLLSRLTEVTSTIVRESSDPNFRVGVYGRDPYYEKSFGADGFKQIYQDTSNQVRHYVGWFAAGSELGPAAYLALRYQEYPNNSSTAPDVALGDIAIRHGQNYNGSWDPKKLANDIWRDVCGREGDLNLD